MNKIEIKKSVKNSKREAIMDLLLNGFSYRFINNVLHVSFSTISEIVKNDATIKSKIIKKIKAVYRYEGEIYIEALMKDNMCQIFKNKKSEYFTHPRIHMEYLMLLDKLLYQESKA